MKLGVVFHASPPTEKWSSAQNGNMFSFGHDREVVMNRIRVLNNVRNVIIN